MLKEFIDRIIDLAPVDRFSVGGREYTSQGAHAIMEPLPDALPFNTLSGFADFAKGHDREGVFVHVVNHGEVHLVAMEINDWMKRGCWAKASMMAHPDAFKFGQFRSPEDFVIGLRSQFVQNIDAETVLKVVGNISSESALQVEDDGVSQSVSQRGGVVLKSRAGLPNSVNLAPFRTFREVTQPESEFFLRAQKGGRDGEMPQLALFEADGSAWKLHAMSNIAAFLRTRLEGYTVLA